MDSTGVPTPRMDWDSANLLEAFRRFRQHVSLMFDGPYKENRKRQKLHIFCNLSEREAGKYTIR